MDINIRIKTHRKIARHFDIQSQSKFAREKEGDLTQSYDKTPYTNRKFENQRTTHTNATKNFDYTTIADRTENYECHRKNIALRLVPKIVS